MPKVSIIVPLYNKAPYVTKALESIASQTYTDWECIIVNDGSTDNSLEVVDAWLKENIDEHLCSIGGHWRLINHPNAGVSAARNHGIAESNGECVCFLDADDWWTSMFLEEMMKFAEEYTEAGLYACNYWYYKPGKTHVAVKRVYSQDGKVCEDNGWGGYMNYPKTYCGGEMPIWTGATMLRKSIIEKREVRNEKGEVFPVGITLGEDFLLWSKIALQYKVAFLNKPLAYYNNDIPASLRLTRHLHAPETHMLWHINRIENDGLKTKDAADWKRLLDRLRLSGLRKYWLSDEYHVIAKKELQKVDWSLATTNHRIWYAMPVALLKIHAGLLQIGSAIKSALK